MTLPGRVVIGADPSEAVRQASRWLVDVALRNTAHRGRFTVALAGGRTPQSIYARLAEQPLRAAIRWAAWHVYFGDERACAPTDPESNYRAARESLLDRVPIPASQVHPMPADSADLDAAAAQYSELLGLSLPAGAGAAPELDCILLGVGADGHTASLFPGTEALRVADAWCTRGRAPFPPHDRLSLTLPVLNAAGEVAFCVTGEEKAAAIARVVEGTVPAALVRPARGELVWFLDQAAAGSLSAKRLPLPGSL